MDILRILRDCLPTDIAVRDQGSAVEISSGTTFKSLGMDSLDFIEYIGLVETAFGIEEMPNSVVKGFKTLGDVEAYLKSAA
jgi:acyl carrier protein